MKSRVFPAGCSGRPFSPKLEVRETLVERAGSDGGAGVWRIRLVLHNTGWLPTYVTKMALERKQLRGTLAEIALPQGATLVSGSQRAELGELEGWAYLHTGISFWPVKKPTHDIAYVEWVVR